MCTFRSDDSIDSNGNNKKKSFHFWLFFLLFESFTAFGIHSIKEHLSEMSIEEIVCRRKYLSHIQCTPCFHHTWGILHMMYYLRILAFIQFIFDLLQSALYKIENCLMLITLTKLCIQSVLEFCNKSTWKEAVKTGNKKERKKKSQHHNCFHPLPDRHFLI